MIAMRSPLAITPAAALLALVSLAAAPATAAPRRPFPQHTAYAAGSLKPGAWNQAQLDADALAAYQGWKSRYLATAGTEPDGHPRYRVKVGTAASAKTVSEGQGYGMLLAVHFAGADPDAQTIFDGLWEFALDHPSSLDPRLMDWSVEANEVPDANGNDSAFDGDADMGLALVLAASQWGGGGRFDYHAEAARVLAGVLASTIGPASHLPLLGDWVDPAGATYNQWTPRSSDFMPGHFRAFAAATGDPAWLAALAAVQQSVTTLQSEVSPATGLLPDFIVPVSNLDHRPRPAPPNFLEGPHDGDYYYNAGRDPWRLATDGLLSGDATSLAQAGRIAQWARVATGGDALAIQGGYQLDGTPIGNFFTSFFAAPLGAAAMTDPQGQAFLDGVYGAVRTRVENYYEDSVTALCLLVMSGNFLGPDSLFADGFESGDTAAWTATVP